MMRLITPLFMRLFLLSTLILLVDQATKQWVLNGEGLPWWLIDGKVGIHLVFNPGIAFSLPVPGWLSILFALVIVVILLSFYRFYLKKTLQIDFFMALVLGGAMGNLVDRFVYGSVVDFIHIFSYPLFNLADTTIFIGIVYLVFRYERIRLR